jgi:hypothetical protein
LRIGRRPRSSETPALCRRIGDRVRALDRSRHVHEVGERADSADALGAQEVACTGSEAARRLLKRATRTNKGGPQMPRRKTF